MPIHLWGTDYRRSTTEFRTRLFIEPEKRAQKLKELKESLGLQDLFYLATCNRIEFYTTAKDAFCGTHAAWAKLLEHFGYTQEDMYKGYYLEGKSALRHLLRVASSLESLVVGEPQILGQLKEAMKRQEQSGPIIKGGLRRSLQQAFATAKKIRTETEVGTRPISVATLGLRLLEKSEAQHPLTTAVLVGTGPITLSVARWLKKNRPNCPLIWVNRSLKNLEGQEECQGAKLLSLSEFLLAPPQFSHLFTATSSSEPLFNSHFFAKLAQQSVLAFDFAQPPDIAPIDQKGVKVIRMETLQSEAKANHKFRAKAMEQADSIIESALRSFYIEHKEAPILKGFSGVEEQLIEKLRSELASLEGKSPRDLESWANKILKQQLHLSREHLRKVLRELTRDRQELAPSKFERVG